MSRLPIVLAITGASGAPYGVRLLDVLARNRVPVWLIVSAHGQRLLAEECGITSTDQLEAATGGDWSSVRAFPESDRGALPASGTVPASATSICSSCRPAPLGVRNTQETVTAWPEGTACGSGSSPTRASSRPMTRRSVTAHGRSPRFSSVSQSARTSPAGRAGGRLWSVQAASGTAVPGKLPYRALCHAP